MREAIAFNAWADKRNGDNPFSPVVENWFHVPGVREVIDRYQAEGRVQQAVQRLEDSRRHGESPAPNNGWAVSALPKV